MTTDTATTPAISVPNDAVYIGGQWAQPSDSGRLDVLNPATEDVIGSIIDSSADTGARAMSAARSAFGAWSARSAYERAEFLDALADAVERDGEQLATLASREIGMPLRESRAVQVDLPVRELRSMAEIARAYDWDSRDASGSTIVREPVGVVLAITPWNFPVHQIVAKLAPALVAGCTMVLKPAELTPFNALFLAALCEQIGLPPGVFNVVTGAGATTGEALLQGRDYDLVSFTGSLRIGRHIGALTGEQVVRTTLELGGKSPAVVLDDAPLETAVRTTVKNCFTNVGQKCNAPSRLIVPEDRRVEAVEIAAEAANAYVLGDPLEEATTMGPVASEEQRRKVLGYVEDARRSGARVVTGGDVAGSGVGFFVRPAIVTDLESTAPAVRDEIFGPVLVVTGHEGEEDAICQANDTEYGLSAEVWSGDAARVAALARRIQAGQVRVNGVRTPALPVSPFGGYKRSGIGREMGPFALEEYLETKAILGDPEFPEPRGPGWRTRGEE